MYEGEDRVRQVNALRQLASDLASGLVGDTEGMLPEEIVSYWEQSEGVFPVWYDEHDRRLLVEFVQAAMAYGRDEPKRKRFTIRLSARERAMLAQIARRHGQTLTDAIRELIIREYHQKGDRK